MRGTGKGSDNPCWSDKMIENDEFLSEHTLAMRKALQACQALLEQDDGEGLSFLLHPEAAQQATLARLRQGRQRALASWHQKGVQHSMETVPYHNDSCQDLCRRFHQYNQPCRILGLKAWFGRVQQLWGSPSNVRQWMRDNTAETLRLPVRRVTEAPQLDTEGRATECAIIQMTLNDWIHHLDNDQQQNNNGPKDYLKDWHFESWLEQQQTPDSNKEPLLYQVPDVLQHDLLHPFLSTFTQGDYRFVYWGPAQSRTDWHSDVLHSFSWS